MYKNINNIVEDFFTRGARFVLVSNNKFIKKEDVEFINISHNDVVVQFKKNFNRDLFNYNFGEYLFLFRLYCPYGKHFGFPFNMEFYKNLRKENLYCFFTEIMPSADELTKCGIEKSSYLFPEKDILEIKKDYPYNKNINFSGPSSGFLFLKYLFDMKNKYHFKNDILLLGFEQEENGSFWVGHNWEYERAWIHAHVKCYGNCKFL